MCGRRIMGLAESNSRFIQPKSNAHLIHSGGYGHRSRNGKTLRTHRKMLEASPNPLNGVPLALMQTTTFRTVLEHESQDAV